MSDTLILATNADYTADSDTSRMPLTVEPAITADDFFQGTTFIAPLGIAALMAAYFVARLFLHA